MTTTATLTKAEILVSVRDEARKILERIGPAGVKSLTDIQNKVDELNGKFVEQEKTVKALKTAMDQQGAAAKRAGDDASNSARKATASTNLWTFAVKTLERVWKGLKSALIIAPLLALTQQLLSYLTEGVLKLVGFGSESKEAAEQQKRLADATKEATQRLREQGEALDANQRRRERGAARGDVEAQIDAIRAAIAIQQAEKAALAGLPLGAAVPEDKLAVFAPGAVAKLQADRLSAAQAAATAAAAGQSGLYPRSPASLVAAGAGFKGAGVFSATPEQAISAVDAEIARLSISLDLLEAKKETTFNSVPRGPSAGVLAEAAFANAPLPPGLAGFTSEFSKNVGLPSGAAAATFHEGGPAFLAGLDLATLQPVQSSAATSFEMLTKALGDQRTEMSKLNYEAALLTTTLAAQSKEEQRATAAASQKLDLMAQVATTDAERIEVINLQIAAEERLLAEQLEAGQLVRTEYEAQLALLGRLRDKKIGDLKDKRGASPLGDEALVGANALASAFSDMAINATSAGQAAKQFFESVVQGLIRVAAQKAALAIFDGLFAGGFGGTQAAVGVLDAKAKGGVFPGHFQAFASGGIANSPTLGLIAEAGQSEAVVPLPDNRSIPVKLMGGGGVTVVVQNTIYANDMASFDDQLERSSKRMAEIVAVRMTTHAGLRESTRSAVGAR